MAVRGEVGEESLHGFGDDAILAVSDSKTCVWVASDVGIVLPIGRVAYISCRSFG
jgi:hypothetical protein